MTSLDLTDIQRFIVRGYRLPYACYYFLRIHYDAVSDSDMPHEQGVAKKNTKARAFVMALREKITLGMEHWQDKVPSDGATTNVAFTYSGLAALGVPEGTLHDFPVEFKQGMKQRAPLLGDHGPNAPQNWDEVWRSGSVHMWISINGVNEDALAAREQWLMSLIDAADGGVELAAKQNVAALKIHDQFTAKEHFGFTDGIGNPVYEGSGAPNIPGRGKLVNGGVATPCRR